MDAGGLTAVVKKAGDKDKAAGLAKTAQVAAAAIKIKNKGKEEGGEKKKPTGGLPSARSSVVPNKKDDDKDDPIA